MEAVVSSETLSVVGFSEVFEKLPQLARGPQGARRQSGKERPDAAVLIDFPDFHVLLARKLRSLGVPLIYYVSPQVWAWRKGRAGTISRKARRIITLFPFEAEIYRRLGADVVWAGHPLVDDVREGLAKPSPLPPAPGRRLMLLPGSRTAELRRHWLPMAQAAERLRERFDLEVITVRAAGLPEGLFDGAEARGIRVLELGHAFPPGQLGPGLRRLGDGDARGCPLRYADGRRLPHIGASFALGRLLVRVPWISLVNIVAEEEIVPELLQGEVTAERLAREGSSLLESPERAARMREGLERVSRRLGPPGGSERAADAVLEVLGIS
jgi:lipid-A-disaccharide synthase